MARAKKNRAVAANAISRLPAMATAAMAHALWRGIGWMVVSALRAPLRAAVLTSMTVGTAFAMSNAMFMQLGPHPAPLFAEKPMTTASVTPAPAPVRRTARTIVRRTVVNVPAELKIEPARQPFRVTEVANPATPIGNAEVFAMQEKLQAMGLFEGKPDGYYGPQTADAIRLFEKRIGREAVGAVNAEIIALIKKAAIAPKPKADIPVVPVVKIKPLAKQSIPNPLAIDPLMKIADDVGQAKTKSVVTAPARDVELVKKVQHGLTSLGFLHGKIDGIAGEATAKAIRNFEVFNNFTMTGTVTAELVDMLASAGAEV